jgi:hypothetical protein
MRTWLIRQCVLVFAIQLLLVAQSFAVSNSTNYAINEDQVGGSGGYDSNSTNFLSINGDNGGATLGDTAVGDSGSTNYQINSGYNSSETPALTVIVSTSSVNFGILSTGSTRTGTALFSVKNYTSYGYVVQTIGTAPTYLARTIAPLAANAGSSIGTEQFGINLVANTVPSVGSAATQVPDATFSNGAAASNYNTANSYRYVNGETIASATKNSGETDYTISYIINISNTTPAGSYVMKQGLLVTGTY